MFSKELMERAKAIFERRSGRVVSDEETVEYLGKLARLGLIAAKINFQEQGDIKKHKGAEDQKTI